MEATAVVAAYSVTHVVAEVQRSAAGRRRIARQSEIDRLSSERRAPDTMPCARRARGSGNGRDGER